MAVLSKLKVCALAIALTACSSAPSAQSIANRLTGPCGPQLGYDMLRWSPGPGAAGDGARIAFDQADGGNVQVAVMDAASGRVTRLTDGVPVNVMGQWLPDGKRILFTSARDGSFQVYAMNADGSGQARLTRDLDASIPSLSPDGAQMAYATLAADGSQAIMVSRVDGSQPVRLSAAHARDYLPAWSPAGSGADRRIAFVSSRGGLPQLYRMDADGGDQRLLDPTPASNAPPFWSPASSLSGGEIAFISSRMLDGALTTTLDLVNADGTGHKQLALLAAGTPAYWPSWSPDGRRIVFVAAWSGGEEITVIDHDGLNKTRLTANHSHDFAPAWSPDGKSIAFVSSRDGADEIYRMDADGSHQTRLTTNPANQKCLRWPF